MKRRITTLLVLGFLPWAGLHAQGTGQTAQTTFRVSATVNAVCEIKASDLSFGTYASNAATPLLGQTTLQATCTPSQTYKIGLNEGASPGATVNQRKMVSGANNLNYQLYSDASRSVIWGNTSSDTVPGLPGTGTEQSYIVYGKVLEKQSVAAGIYSDTITVRIYY